MNNFEDVVEFRKSSEAVEFSEGWLLAQRNGDWASDFHLNLLAWSLDSPFHVLGIVLNLIDRVGDDDDTSEQIAMGPVEWLVEKSPETFLSVLREAVRQHPGFALYTRGKRVNPPCSRWALLNRL